MHWTMAASTWPDISSFWIEAMKELVARLARNLR
jgi:hypothetical protein